MAVEIPFARYKPIFDELRREVVQDRVTGLAAEIAFFSVLSIFPGLLIVAAALGSLDALVGSDLALESKKQILGFLNLILTSRADGAIQAVEELFDEGSGGVLTLASGIAIVGLSRAFAVVTGALNLAYDSGEDRPWVKRRVLGVFLSLGTVVMAVLMLVMIVVGPFLGKGTEVAAIVGLSDAWTFTWGVLRWPVAFVMLVLWATALFHFAPCRKEHGWRSDMPGALVTAVLWLVVSLGLNVYLTVAAGANPIFGVLGGGLILLVWLYLLSLSLLIGGELNPIIARYRMQKRTVTRAEAPVEAR